VGVNGLVLARLGVEDEESDPSLGIGFEVGVAALLPRMELGEDVKAGELALKVELSEEGPAASVRRSMLLGHDLVPWAPPLNLKGRLPGGAGDEASVEFLLEE